jgi:E3 ubiquitin-protein ligase TRIP12
LHTLNTFNQPKKDGVVIDGDCFLNKKIISKLGRQLRESLTVTTEALPLWCKDLSKNCKFLFPFDVRVSFFRSSSLGVARGLRELEQRLSPDGKPSNHSRIPKQRVRLARAKPLESAMKAMELCVNTASTKYVFGVEFFDEKGVGLGPTKLMSDFSFLGRLVAKAIMDNRLLDIPFSNSFYKLLLDEPLTFQDLKDILPEVGDFHHELELAFLRRQSILNNPSLDANQKKAQCAQIKIAKDSCNLNDIAALELEFSLAQGSLSEKKRDDFVTVDNLGDYLNLVKDVYLGEGIRQQIEAFRTGFNQFFPIVNLQVFTPPELGLLISGTSSPQSWTQEEILSGLLFGVGLSEKSKVIKFLLELLMSFTEEQRRYFLIWITATPRLPVGGWSSLSPKITIMAKVLTVDTLGEDQDVPTANACFHQLKVPAYSTIDIMKERMIWAMGKGTGSFDLT